MIVDLLEAIKYLDSFASKRVLAQKAYKIILQELNTLAPFVNRDGIQDMDDLVQRALLS